MGKLYLTTTLPYVNAEPHIGFALEIVQADALARFHRDVLKDEVFFNTGVDEHGQKIYDAAAKAGKDVKAYVDRYAAEFKKLKETLNLSYSRFIRTTEPAHYTAAQEMWRRCAAAGDIYKKKYEGLYCVGCERFLTEKDMVDGKCVIHNMEPKLLFEENYFFRFTKYEKRLFEYLARPGVIIPDWRRSEAVEFVKAGLEDFSISREKARLSWGVPVPGDDAQVMYVWFEALVSYISALGWPDDPGGNFEKFWEKGKTLQLAGKDQVRFQSLMWQAMLMSAGVKATDTVFYHGFINSGGQKMSKSLGNVISPYELAGRYGIDATRYLLLRHMHPFEDSAVTWERLDEWYNAGLANGLGNLVARVMKLAETYLDGPVNTADIRPMLEIQQSLETFEFNRAMDNLWSYIQDLDEMIQEEKPFEMVKANRIQAKKRITHITKETARIAKHLAPFMPETSEKILAAITANKKPDNLFPRLV